MAVTVGKSACPDCGSSDSLHTYADGGKYCWGQCNTDGKGFKRSDKVNEFAEAKETGKKNSKLITQLDYAVLSDRGNIPKDICQKYGYAFGEHDWFNDEDKEWETIRCQVANYYNTMGQVVAQKLRTKDKKFQFIGKPAKTMLWGQHLWRNKGGRKIIITEGEIDCLSVATAYGGKYPVVSISTGIGTAKDCLIANLDFLESFDQIILWFDSDEKGQEGLELCKGLFSPKKLYYMPFDAQYKDANEVFKAEKTQGIIQRIYEAVEFREDAVVRGSDVNFTSMRKNIHKGRPLPYPKLQSMTMGSRDAELWIWTAGSGIGKSTIVTEVAKFQIDGDPRVNVGCLYLEESISKTADRFMALEHNIPLKDLRLDHELIEEEDAYGTYEKYFKSNRLNFYNHFGSVEPEKLLQKIRYMHIAENCNTIILDHISIAVSGLTTDENERKTLDVFMTQLRSFVEETGCTVHAIVHLKRVTGKNFNEGASVSLSDLRGSASLEQLSDTVISAERDQQGNNPFRCILRVLKCRETGETGVADAIAYIPSTGRYILADDEVEFEDSKSTKSNY